MKREGLERLRERENTRGKDEEEKEPLYIVKVFRHSVLERQLDG